MRAYAFKWLITGNDGYIKTTKTETKSKKNILKVFFSVKLILLILKTTSMVISVIVACFS